MFARIPAAFAALLLLLAAPAAAQSVAPADLMRHIQVLASDEYEGRKPGTPGEERTIAYIAGQMKALGLEPGGTEGSWFQPLDLFERAPVASRVRWFRADGTELPFDQAHIVLLGRDPEVRIARAPVWHVGGAMPADAKGAVLLLPVERPGITGSIDDRIKAAREAGAAAVIALLGNDLAWESARRAFVRGQRGLEIDFPADALGAMHAGALAGLALPPGTVRLPVTASIEATSEVRRYTTHNVIGRLPGAGRTGENLLYLAHWDHLGICRPDEANRICNGAVDNASGIALMLEVARHLAAGPRPQRDLLFMATTAEEMGLLGADYFARRPTVPLDSIVAALNIDTVAVHGRGEPVAIIGRGFAAELDAAVAEAARAQGRPMDETGRADAFIRRQDGWALMRAGVPAIMVGGSFANPAALEAFLQGPYHKPDDDLLRDIPLDGAAEDAELMILLGRILADPARYRRAAR